MLKCLPDQTLVYNDFVLSHSTSSISHPPIQVQTHRNLTSIHFPTHGLIAAHINKPAVAKMKINTTASSFLESRSAIPKCQLLHLYLLYVQQSHPSQRVRREKTKDKRTKTRSENILHPRAPTNRQVIIQTKLPIAIIAIPRSVFFSILLPLSLLSPSPIRTLPLPPLIFSIPRQRVLRQRFLLLFFRIPWGEDSVGGARSRGNGGVEGDDGAVCEAGAFAEGGWCCC